MENTGDVRTNTNDGGMQSARISLNASIPLCWEEPETLRFGFDRAELRLPDPAPNVQHLLRRLKQGMLEDDLASYAASIELSADELRQLLRALEPVLLRETSQKLPSTSEHNALPGLAILGEGPAAEHLRALRIRSGFQPPRTGVPAEFAILVSQFWGATGRSSALLSEHIPHLSLRFTDRAFYVGPILLPEGELCQHCIELHEQEREPQLRLIAAQLADQAPAAASRIAVPLASAICVAALHHWRQGSTQLLRSRLRFRVRHGIPDPSPRQEELQAHPDCSCNELKLAQRSG